MSHPVSKSISSIRLPLQLTPFIGRSRELAEINNLLCKQHCRLLTLVGPGGIGKTRLVVAVGESQAARFYNGIYFVSLQHVNSVDFLISAIADTLDFPLTGQENLTKQLCQYLKDKEILLILDNFEQLLPENGEMILDDMLRLAPNLKLLVTTREALNLQEEWLYMVPGLSLPDKKDNDDRKEAESVKLFYERAQRVRQDFSLEGKLDDVAQICRLVEGAPLALELAASWTNMLSCRQIVDELAKSFDLLATNRGNVPDRQQSMRIIFDQTWQQLNQQERNVLKKLSIFRGGFGREAAERIAEASLPLLANLRAKALIRWDGNGRYHIHELLRQYAAEKLAENSTELSQIHDAHCNYFTEYLAGYEIPLMDSRQVQATQEIESDLENVRVAWQWAVAQINVNAIQKASFALGNFYQFQSRYAEALKMFEPASSQLLTLPESEERDLALINTLMVRSWFYLRFGRLDEVTAVMEHSQALHHQLNIDPGPGYVTNPDIMLAFVDLIHGDFDKVVQRAQRVRQTSKRLNQPGNREFAYYLSAQAALAQGQYDAAQKDVQEAYAISLAMDDRWFRAYILNTLAELAGIKQDYATAQKYYQTSHGIRQEFNDAEGMAVALTHLSDIALRQENYAEAQNYYEQSLQLYQEINDTGGLATSHGGLAYTALAQGDTATAREHYFHALKLAAEIWYISALLNLCTGVGEWLCRIGEIQKGLTLFYLVEYHSASTQEMKNRAAYLADSFKLQVKSEASAEAVRAGQAADLEAAVKALLVELPLIKLPAAGIDSSGGPEVDPNQMLVEPLTARELDVLQLLAEGFSNKEIAEQLILAEGTVKYYTRQIYGKLQVRNRVRAVAVARELNLV